MLEMPVRVLDSYAHQLSGGMKQRMITVISTLQNPRLLIADEPTSALDVSSQRMLVEMLLAMVEQRIMSGVVFVTHDLPVLSDRMLEMPVRVLDSYAHQLSGGMKQRMITVISTLQNPRLLIADEPTSALDVSSQRMLVEMLLAMVEQRIMSGVVFVTHDLPVLSQVSDQLAIMNAGRIWRQAPPVSWSRSPSTTTPARCCPPCSTRARRRDGGAGRAAARRGPPAGRPRGTTPRDAAPRGRTPRPETRRWARDEPVADPGDEHPQPRGRGDPAVLPERDQGVL